MSLILKFLSGPLGLYVVIAVSVALLGAVGTAAYEHQRAARYQVERDGARHDNEKLLKAVGGKDNVIQSLGQALKQWEQISQRQRMANEAAAQRAEQYRQQQSTERVRIKELAEKDRELPDCQKLLQLDVAAVCPGIASSVRDYAKHSLR